MSPQDRLILSPPIPHAGATTSFGTSVTELSATNAASYSPTGSGSFTANLSLTVPCVSKVTITNLHATQTLYVNVGNTIAVPPDPTAGSFPVVAGQQRTFEIPGAGRIGCQGDVKVLGSGAATTGSVQWHP